MPEENTSTIPPVPPSPKKQTWKTVLTIVFLILFWPVGIILTWTLAPWRKKAKIIVTIVFVVIAILIPIIFMLLAVVFVGVSGVKDAAR